MSASYTTLNTHFLTIFNRIFWSRSHITQTIIVIWFIVLKQTSFSTLTIGTLIGKMTLLSTIVTFKCFACVRLPFDSIVTRVIVLPCIQIVHIIHTVVSVRTVWCQVVLLPAY